MDTSHCHYRGYIVLVFLFYSFVFGLASNIDISDDAKGSKTNSTPRRFLSNSIYHGKDMGKEYIRCAESDLEIPQMDISCEKTSKDVVRNINFADYGNPSGKCEHYRHGNCGASNTLRIVKKNCLGKHKCVLLVSDEMFGTSHCNKDIQLFVQVTCTKP
ncbi:hypothetical protein BRARA_D00554 [Brassica rapa]|uniref:SUEL-type lectin domain-containing protein n=2 Tax=Brassica campestris TaxID=3711 RepID=A0A397ZLX8_BRACM|nr:beta-galactosidase 15-like [Brassica rapa]KAG5400654.1 hypothetical protein IGI04_015261 [Brassica rapa subsp. trilocularis]RID65354.1 hypothetical protein BRARA_D00554 [Brassica rapa]